MHPSPPSSIHLHSAPRTSIYFHQAHFSIHPALCNTLNIITTKILHVIGQFPQIQTKKNKSCPFGLKISTHGILEVYTDSRFRLRFLKSQPQNPFLGKFGLKKSKLPLLPDNWHIHKVFQRC